MRAGTSFSIVTPYIDRKDLNEEPQGTKLLPAASFNKDARIIPFFDANHSTLRRLLAASEYSPTVARIIGDLSEMALGGGIEGSPREIAAYEGKANPYGQTVEEIVQRAVIDYLRTGNAAIECVEALGRRMVYYRTLDTIAPVTDEYPAPPVAYAADVRWEAEQVRADSKTQFYGVWPELREVGDTQRAIIHAKRPATGRHYWGLPQWYSALLWAEVDYLIALHNQSLLNHGMTPASIITFVGNLTDEESEELLAEYRKKMEGAGNAGKSFLLVVEDPDMAPKVQTLDTGKDADWEKLQRMATQNIVTAFRWTMSLAGVATEGRLGSNQQMSTELQYVEAMAVRPFMREVTLRILRPVLQFVLKTDSVGASLMGSLPSENLAGDGSNGIS